MKKNLVLLLIVLLIPIAILALPNDNYGRAVTEVTSGSQDQYTVTSSSVPQFTLGVPTGTDQGSVYSIINAVAPGSFSKPDPGSALSGISTDTVPEGTTNLYWTSLRTAFNGSINSNPGRSLDTTFTPNATKFTMVIYTVQITAAATVSGSQGGVVQLMSDNQTTPTTSRCSTENTSSVTLGIGVGISNTQRGILYYIVPPGHKVKLVTTKNGTPTITLLDQTEIALGVGS